MTTMKNYHVYIKGVHGWGLFYRMEDCLMFYTLFSTLAREMRLRIIAFCLMFNHIHFLVEGISQKELTRFMKRLSTLFSLNYNQGYGRSGQVLHKSYGKAAKRSMKKLMGCIAYIFNNPVAGKMCRRAWNHRWTLLAYYQNPHPYSERLIKRNCRFRMRRALKVVDIHIKQREYLNHATLTRIFDGLTSNEKAQLTDYIVFKYNFLNYSRLSEIYESFDKMLVAVDSNAGAEHDMEDDCGDHSVYQKMIAAMNAMGYKGKNIETLRSADRDKLTRHLLGVVRSPRAQFRKFMHYPA